MSEYLGILTFFLFLSLYNNREDVKLIQIDKKY